MKSAVKHFGVLLAVVLILAACAPAPAATTAPAAPAATNPPAAPAATTAPAAPAATTAPTTGGAAEVAPATPTSCTTKHTMIFIPGQLSNPSQAAGWKELQKDGPQYCFNVSVIDGGGDVQVQAKAVSDAIAQHPDAILVNPNDAKAIVPSLTAAKQAGIVVGLFMVANAPGSDSSINYFVTMDDIKGGEQAAQAIEKAFPNGATGVEVGGQAGHIAAINRHQGFTEGLKGSNIQVLDYKNPQQWDAAQAQSIMENFITKYGDKIQFVFCHWDGGATGVINALQAAGMTKVMIVAVDGNQAAFKNIQSWPGTYISIGQSVPKITALSLTEANKWINKDPTAALPIYVPLDILNKDTIGNFPVPEW